MMAGGIEIRAPELGRFQAGNTGIPYVTSWAGAAPGPHAVITALVHGNELSGAHALVALHDSGIRPKRGRISLAFVNIQAFEAFDPVRPKASRYLDQDLNRVWSAAVLDSSRQSRELARARELRPLIESADRLLDLHSMQLASPPLLLAGTLEKGRALARTVGFPATVVADAGHRNGARMRDFGAFADPASPAAAILLEAGAHWAKASIDVAIRTCRQFLAGLDLVDPRTLDRLGPPPPPAPQQLIEVSHAITVRHEFRYVRDVKGLEVVAKAGTIIAYDGDLPVRTPYPDCVLVMPSRRLSPGLTAVRLGRSVPL
jgi:predicted deacylase